MGTADVKQPPPLPPLCQRLQLAAEYRPMSKVIPAGSYLIKDFFYSYLAPLLISGKTFPFHLTPRRLAS